MLDANRNATLGSTVGSGDASRTLPVEVGAISAAVMPPNWVLLGAQLADIEQQIVAWTRARVEAHEAADGTHVLGVASSSFAEDEPDDDSGMLFEVRSDPGQVDDRVQTEGTKLGGVANP